MIPFLCGTIGLLVMSWTSDLTGKRVLHYVIGTLAGFVGLMLAGHFSEGLLTIVFISIATTGLYGSRSSFWPLPPMYLTGARAAAGIALINAIGNLGGFFGPPIIGWLKDTHGNFSMALYFMGACALLSTILMLITFAGRSQPKAIENVGSQSAT